MASELRVEETLKAFLRLGIVLPLIACAGTDVVKAQQPSPRPAPAQYTRVAVLPFEGIDVETALLHEIEAELLSEIDEMADLEPVSPRDVLSDLERYAVDPSQCGGDVACLARAGRYARGHLVIETRVATLGGSVSISLRLIDTVTAVQLRHVADYISEKKSDRVVEMHRIMMELLIPERFVGSLEISCKIDGADVYLDDKLVGQTPLAKPVRGIRAGPHILRVAKAGFSDFHGFVDVVYRRVSTIEVDLVNATIVARVTFVDSSSGTGTLYVGTNESGITVRVDGEPIGVTVFEEAIEVPAGRRRISLQLEGRASLTREIVIEPMRRTQVAVTADSDTLRIVRVEVVDIDAPLPTAEETLALVAQPAIAPAAERVSPPTGLEETGASPSKLYGGLGLGGGGVLALAVMTYFSQEVNSLNRDADALRARANNASNSELASLNVSRRRLNEGGRHAELGQWVSLGIGAALIAAGSGLLLWEWFDLEGAKPDAVR